MANKPALPLVALLIGCCLISGGSAQASPFLDALWRNTLMLKDNQTMTEKQFKSVLSDLRIGAKFNASACGGAPLALAPAANASTADSCLTGAQLTGSFGINLTAGLGRDDFSNLAVAMLQQQLAKRCLIGTPDEHHDHDDDHDHDHDDDHDHEHKSNNTTREIKWAYIYGTVSVTVISLLSCVGCMLIACHRASCYPHLLLFFVELAVGSLVGESLLHLLPTVVENGSHDHQHGSKGIPDNFFKLVTVAATICVLHAVDTGSVAIGLEGHSHGADEPVEGQAYSVSTVEAEASATRSEEKSASSTFSFGQAPRVSLRQLLRHPKRWFSGPMRLCLFVMLSDALHNFADGVAVGAAFSISDADGLRLSLSVGLHELAHELADFAVLLSCGFSVPGAVAINLACTVTAFAGLYVAVPLAEASAAAQVWILAVAAAMFLYIALVTMTSLVRRSYRPKSMSTFIVGNLGLICGFLSVIAISMYEFYG